MFVGRSTFAVKRIHQGTATGTKGDPCRKKLIEKGLRLRLWTLIILTAFTACSPSRDSSSPAASVNVVIIVMDTTRQDHMACYGYERDTTPNLTKLAAGSTTYTRAYTPGGWTPPAHASLFTGLYSIAHQTTQEAWWMGDHLTTLAEIFKAEGYETIGVVENPMLNTRFNFNQGFSQYHETWRFPEIGGNRIFALFKKLLQYWESWRFSKGGKNRAFSIFKESLNKRKAEKPFFMFINLNEPHSPYNSSRQFYYQFVSDKSVRIEENMWRKFFLGEKTFTENEIRHLQELYDAEILYVDYLIGKMIQELKMKSLWEKTVFIVTSDHGENIGDHEMMDHVFSLHESIIKVPLIIHYPTLSPPGVRYDYPVQLTDIFPTLLEIIGVDPQRYPSQGHSLLERKAGDNALVFSEYYFPKQVLENMDRMGLLKQDERKTRLDKYKRRIRALIKGDMKLIWGSDGNHELYDLRRDQLEKENLIARQEYAKVAEELQDLLESLVKKYDLKMKKARSVKETELDEATREELKSLGYLR